MAGLPVCGLPPVPVELWSRWGDNPAAVLAVAAVAILPRRRTAGADRWFAAGLVLLALLLLSPLCALSMALFSARVVHHMVLIAAVAPLLVLGGLRLPARWTGRGAITAGFAIQTAAVWLWHLPVLYDGSLTSPLLYWLMQGSLLAGGVLFWAAVLGRTPATGPGDLGAALVALLGTMMQMGLLGALLTFAGRPLYGAHQGATAPWGLTVLEDQQLGGLILWVPAALPYLAATVLLLALRLGDDGPARGSHPSAGVAKAGGAW